MKSKIVATGAALLLSLAGVATAKSWEVVVDSSAKAGAMELPAGDYSVKLNGNQATFQSSDTGKRYTVPVKVQKVDKKYGDTAVENTKQGNTEIIQKIELGGTNTELDFGE